MSYQRWKLSIFFFFFVKLHHNPWKYSHKGKNWSVILLSDKLRLLLETDRERERASNCGCQLKQIGKAWARSWSLVCFKEVLFSNVIEVECICCNRSGVLPCQWYLCVSRELYVIPLVIVNLVSIKCYTESAG